MRLREGIYRRRNCRTLVRYFGVKYGFNCYAFPEWLYRAHESDRKKGVVKRAVEAEEFSEQGHNFLTPKEFC